MLPTVNEESMLEQIFEEEEEHDVGDDIVDGWTQRLVTHHKSIWFEDLYNQDVAARIEGLNVEIIEEPAHEGVVNKVEKEDYISLRTLIQEGLKASVEKGIKVVIDKVDEMDKRLRAVEAFVKEKSASTRDGEPPLVELVTLCNTRVSPNIYNIK